MMTNGLTEPIGYDFSSLSFSWIVECEKANKVIAAKVEIALDSQFTQLVHNSKYQKNISSLEYSPQLTLKPRTRYYWRVSVKTDQENIKIQSNYTFFETGKMNEKWEGKWITTSLSQTIPPYIRKSFNLKIDSQKSISDYQSRIYICALGLYELYTNGKKVSNEHFTPYCTGYNFWLQYQSYDVSKYIKKGKNVIGVMLGDGWAKGRFWFSTSSADMTMKTDELGSPINLATNQYQLICELHIKSDDKEDVVILSDDTWKCEKSPIVRNNIYDGEVYNANYQIENWCLPNYSDKDWKKTTIITNQDSFNLTDRLSPPVIEKKRIKPKKILTENVIDIGQNIAGWIELTIQAPKDFETIIEFGEIFNDGQFINENLRTAKQQFRVISNGQKIRISPHFTFYGFQYVKFTQFHKSAKYKEGDLIEYFDITAHSIYSDLEEIGRFECGQKKVNRLYSNAFWSQRDNFLDVPTDCPQRDERMGWTGDAQAFCSTGMFNMGAYSFYRKYLRDLYLLQKASYRSLGGAVSSIVPFYGEEPEEQMAGRVGWADAATIIPMTLYLHTGRKQVLRDQFESMKMWVDFVGQKVFSLKKSNNSMDDRNYGGLWKADSFHFGDWLALDGKVGTNVGGTELTYICSCYYYYSLKIFTETIEILNDEKLNKLLKKYKMRLNQTLSDIRDEYLTGSGRIAIQTQSAQALALYLNISTNKKTVLHSLKKLLYNTNHKLKTGFIGTPILCRSLSDSGDPFEAYNVFLDDKYPGWLFEVKMNSTSIWERWNSIDSNGKFNKKAGMNSLNHYASGSVVEWLYRNVCGINPVRWAAGFKEFLLHPQPDIRLKWAEAVVNTSMGKIRSSWKICTDGAKKCVISENIDEKNVTLNDHLVVTYEFVVPFDTVAHLRLRNTLTCDVKYSKARKEITFIQDGDDVLATLLPGNYTIKTPYVQAEIPIDDHHI
ncbi:hypothetical protein M9Y10_043372 [Tritrichomonas musculus]|uniref:alpha-L-rhamnosidase n=1 Tax=Tritrichomonas musculus TaxID=1915356 RepID=A0ABR2JZG6_9EUKA